MPLTLGEYQLAQRQQWRLEILHRSTGGVRLDRITTHGNQAVGRICHDRQIIDY